MLRQRMPTRLAFLLWFGLSALGCGSLNSSGIGRFAWTDPLQRSIFQQPNLESDDGVRGRKDPVVVLKEVPLGTPLKQARLIMSRHGFHCEEQAGGNNDSFLLCEALRNTGWMTAEVIKVRLYHQAGRVSAVEVCAYFDAP